MPGISKVEEYCSYCTHCNSLEWNESKILTEGPQYIRRQSDILTRIFMDRGNLILEEESNLKGRIKKVQKNFERLVNKLDAIRDSGISYNPELDKIRSVCFKILSHIQAFNANSQIINRDDRIATGVEISAAISFCTGVTIFISNAFIDTQIFSFNGSAGVLLTLASYVVGLASQSCKKTASEIDKTNKWFVQNLQDIIKDFNSPRSNASLADRVTNLKDNKDLKESGHGHQRH